MPLAEHRQHREGDEVVCACGMRWGVDEEDPHQEQPKADPREIIDQLKMELDNDER